MKKIIFVLILILFFSCTLTPTRLLRVANQTDGKITSILANGQKFDLSISSGSHTPYLDISMDSYSNFGATIDGNIVMDSTEAKITSHIGTKYTLVVFGTNGVYSFQLFDE